MSTDKKVIGLVVNDGPIEKTKDNCGRPAFCVRGVYLMEDGTTEPARLVSQRKKHIPERIADEKLAVENGCLTINGPFVTRRFYIGPKKAA
jgi:hypothetical protein